MFSLKANKPHFHCLLCCTQPGGWEKSAFTKSRWFSVTIKAQWHNFQQSLTFFVLIRICHSHNGKVFQTIENWTLAIEYTRPYLWAWDCLPVNSERVCHLSRQGSLSFEVCPEKNWVWLIPLVFNSDWLEPLCILFFFGIHLNIRIEKLLYWVRLRASEADTRSTNSSPGKIMFKLWDNISLKIFTLQIKFNKIFLKLDISEIYIRVQ